MLKKIIPIIPIGLSIFVVILVLVYAVFVKPEPVQLPVNNDISPTTMPDDISEIDTSDWKVYTNEEFGFEIKHPKDWGASTGEPRPWHKDVLGIVYVTGHSIEDIFYAPIAITTLSNEKRLSIKEWYQEYYPNGDISRLQEVKFDKTSGMRKLSLWNDGLDGFYFSNEDKIYSVSIMDLQENAENQRMMTEKMLSTFTFIESIDGAIWKTYRNEEFGFEVKYPSALYFFDCSKNFHEPNPLYVHFTPYVEDNCNTPGKAKASVISVSTVKDFDKNNIINLLDKNIKEKNITIGNKSAVQISGDREVTGDEGEKLSSAPIREMFYTIISFENNISIQISYHRIASIENDVNGFYVGEDLSKIYNKMLSTFKFTNPS